MARVILDNETYNAATSGAVILGRGGSEQVNVFAGVTGLNIASTIERVDLPGNVADFEFSSFGNSLTISKEGDVIAAISGAGGKTIAFGDGALAVTFDGTLTLGGVTVGSTPAPITPSEIDAETTSEVAPKQFGWLDDDTYVSGANGGYSIRFDVYNEPDQSLLQGIANAAERISQIIIKGVPEYQGIDDIWVAIHFTDIDGWAWGIGSAHGLRPDSLLPSRGIMKLDSSASQSITPQRFEDLVFHEFLHCLGFGGRWDDMGLIQGNRFTGPAAIAAYHSEFSSIAAKDADSHLGVPLEDSGHAGSVGKHWDDSTFGDEVMTSYLNGSNYVSPLTIAALADMGYEVII